MPRVIDAHDVELSGTPDGGQNGVVYQSQAYLIGGETYLVKTQAGWKAFQGDEVPTSTIYFSKSGQTTIQIDTIGFHERDEDRWTSSADTILCPVGGDGLWDVTVSFGSVKSPMQQNYELTIERVQPL